jgi:hypothetical protein
VIGECQALDDIDSEIHDLLDTVAIASDPAGRLRQLA